MAFLIAFKSPPVERSITVSAPYLIDIFNFSISSSMLLFKPDEPILALTLHFKALPIPIGCKFV